MPERDVADVGAGPAVSWALGTWLTPVMVVVIGVVYVAIGAVVDGGRAWWVGVAVVLGMLGLAMARGPEHPRRAGAGVALAAAAALTVVVNLLMWLG